MNQQSIYIIGAGAIGKALAVFLKLAGRDVTLVRGSVDGKPDLVETITVELPHQTSLEADVEIKTLSRIAHFRGVVVLTNKSFGNEALTTNRLRFKPVATSPIGVIKGEPEALAKLVHQLDNPFFPFRITEDIQLIIWTKAIVNSVFNSICPLLETDNGIFFRNEKALAIGRRVIRECIAVAEASGVFLQEAKVVDTLLLISRSSEGQLISTYQDLLHQRQTEICTLNMAIANAAGQLGLHDRVPETSLLGELIVLKSEISR